VTAFYVGDVPAFPLVYSPAAELSEFTAAVVYVDDTALTTVIDGNDVLATIKLLPSPGVHSVRVVLTNVTKRETYELEPLVVETRNGWHTLASARREWPDAAVSDAQLFNLLAVARGQVEAYAPALPHPVATPPEIGPNGWIYFTETPQTGVPDNYRLAQLMQARNIFSATQPNSDTGYVGDFAPAPARPLDWHVQQLLRPKKGRPSIG
jgi:hypothetical protein